MSIINFTMADVDDDETVTLQGYAQHVKLFWRKTSSCWFYIPRYIVKTLNLKPKDTVYFYIISRTTLVMSFRNPYLKSARKRKIGYAGCTRDLTAIIPTGLIPKNYLQTKDRIQIINTTGTENYEWQIRFV